MGFQKLGKQKEPPPRTVYVLFPTTADAFACESACRRRGLEGRLTSIPRRLSAGCGFAWASPASSRSALEECLAEEHVEFEAIAEM